MFGVDLRDADLTGADLRRVTLEAATLRGAVLCGADLTGARMATADLRAVDSDEDTLWPDGVLRPRATDAGAHVALASPGGLTARGRRLPAGSHRLAAPADQRDPGAGCHDGAHGHRNPEPRNR